MKHGVVDDLGDGTSNAIHCNGVTRPQVTREKASLGRVAVETVLNASNLSVLDIVVHVIGAVARNNTMAILSAHIEVLVG
jgi:hypothetical protein